MYHTPAVNAPPLLCGGADAGGMFPTRVQMVQEIDGNGK